MKRKFMKLEGIGKYPHITVKLCSGKKTTCAVTQSRQRVNTLSESPATSTINSALTSEEIEIGNDNDSISSSGVEAVVDFGEVSVGSVTKKRIEITNVSPVSHMMHYYAVYNVQYSNFVIHPQ